MLNKDDIRRFLFEADNIGNSETYHEAVLLFVSLYEKSADIDREILIKDLIGNLASNDTAKHEGMIRKEHEIFVILESLNKKGIELTETAKSCLGVIKERHPKWEIGSDDDISSPMYVEWRKNPFTVEEIILKDPAEIAEMLLSHKDSIDRSRRDLSETVGLVCRKDPEWANILFVSLDSVINELPVDTMNPILWNLRFGEGGGKISWEINHIMGLLKIFDEIVSKRPDPEFFMGLASLIKNWEKIFGLGLQNWESLVNKLLRLFENYDYGREEKKVPIEWIQRAINHPYGSLTELFMDYAHKMVLLREKDGPGGKIDLRILNFLEYSIKNYRLGTRYGICIIGQWLSWLESIDPDWTISKMIPLFLFDEEQEKSLIVWSGYLWSRTLSSNLANNFDETYLKAAQHYNEFGESEKRGLITHVAGLVWFKLVDIVKIKSFIPFIDKKGRLNLLQTWQHHLAKSEKRVAEEFWRNVIIPYWTWSKDRFLRLPDGNDERFEYWNLLPFSYAVFPKASHIAIELAPANIEHINLFIKNLEGTKYSKLYPEEFINFLVAFIRADNNPQWHIDEWKELWDAVKDSKGRNLDILENGLARKRII